MIDWLNDNEGAVQVFLTLILVLVAGTALLLNWIAARAAIEQARVTEEARMDEARPVIALRRVTQEEFGTGGKALERAFSELWSDDHVWFRPVNIGRGPALNLVGVVRGTDGKSLQREMGTQAIGDHDNTFPFSVIGGFVSVHYQDVYGRGFVSRRTVTFNEDGPQVGSLEVGLKEQLP